MKKLFIINEINQIPNGLCGVYYLYNKNRDMIYIGKSNNISNRIKTHIRLNYKNFKNFFYSFNFHRTPDELTALLLESKEIKFYKPLFNKKLRRSKKSNFFLSYSKNKNDIFYLSYTNSPSINSKSFSSKKALLLFINDFLIDNGLCVNVNRNSSKVRPCFQHHIGNCMGICINDNLKHVYNKKFLFSIEDKKVKKFQSLTFCLNGINYKALYDGFFLRKFYSSKYSIKFNYNSYDESSILLSYLRVNKVKYKVTY